MSVEAVHQVAERPPQALRQTGASAWRDCDLAAAVLDTTSALVVVLDPEGHVVRFSRACEKLSGYSAAEVLGRTVWDLFLVPEEKEGALVTFGELRAGVFPNSHESHWRTRSGELRLISWSNTALVGDDGLVEYIVATGVDVTEQRQAEKDLKASEQRFRLVADFTYDWEYWLGPDGRYLYMSPACERITGYRPEELLAEPALFFRLIHPGDRPRVEQHRKDNDPSQCGDSLDFRIVSRSGEQRWINHVCQPVYDDNGTYLGRRGSNRDITDRKRMEAALEASERRWRVVLERAGTAIITADSRGTITSWNHMAEEMFGYAAEETIGQPLTAIMPQRFWAAHAMGLHRALDTGRTAHGGQAIETVGIRRDGSEFPLEMSLAVWQAESDSFVTAIARDISGRKMAEEALQRYAEEQTALYAVASATAATLQLDQLLAAVLDAVLPVAQAEDGWILLSSSQIPGDPQVAAWRPAPGTLIGSGVPQAPRNCPLYTEKLPVPSEPIINCANLAREAPALHSLIAHLCIPLEAAGRLLGVLGVGWRSSPPTLNLTRQLLQTIGRQVGMALHNAQLYRAARQVDRLQVLYDLDRALATILDPHRVAEIALQQIAVSLHASAGVILLVPSPAETSLYKEVTTLAGGWSTVEVTPQNAEWWRTLLAQPGSSRAVVPCSATDLRSLGEHDEIAALWGAEGIVVPICDEHSLKAVLALGGRAADQPFSDEDRALALLAANQVGQTFENARLYKELKELLEEREQARTQLVQSEKMAALGRLVASIAHEINNPLQSVSACLTLLQEELEGRQRPEKVSRHLNVVQSEIERIAALLRNMRDYYRPSREGLELVDVQQVLGSVLELTARQVRDSQVRVERRWAPNLPPIQANLNQLKQVFLNLVLNALDAMPGGGELRIATFGDQLQIDGLAAPQPAVTIEIRDSGPGMSEVALSRVFEPFFTTKGEGAGLGLYVSYGIIAAHQGQIGVTSQEGAGSTFTIRLPVQQPRKG